MPFPTEPIEVGMFRAWSRFIKECIQDEEVRLWEGDTIIVDGPYTMIKVTNIEKVSQYAAHEAAPTDATGRGETFANYIGTISIYTYGKYSMSRAFAIESGLRERLTKQVLSENGLGYKDSTDVRDASRQLNSESTEQRAQFSVEFHFVAGGTERGGDDPSVIETVNGEGSLSDDCGETYDYTEPFSASYP